jgi:hypothetical protein
MGCVKTLYVKAKREIFAGPAHTSENYMQLLEIGRVLDVVNVIVWLFKTFAPVIHHLKTGRPSAIINDQCSPTILTISQ